MSARDAIVQRLRQGRPLASGAAPSAPPVGTESGDPTRWLEVFTEALLEVGGDVVVQAPGQTLAEVIGDVFGAADVKSVLVSAEGTLDGVAEELLKHLPGARVRPYGSTESQDPNARRYFASFEGAVTGAEALIAETGSVVLTDSVERPAGLSHLTTHHVVVASRDMLLADLDASLAADWSRAQRTSVWVTGPSRTADIEKTLITGMHGPRRLTVIILA